MEQAAQFRAHAQESRRLAEQAASGELRALLLEMAQHWDALADIREQIVPLSRRDRDRT